MILDYLFHKAESISVPLELNNSLCSKMRFGDSGCTDCMDACPFQAIEIDNEIEISVKKCEGCLICASVCKNEAISANIKFSALENLRLNNDKVLIGCTKSDNVHHFRKSCIGWLSKEVLAYLGSASDKGVAIDVTQCKTCKSIASYEYVENLVSELNRDFPNLNISLLSEKNSITPFAKTLDRRAFFTNLGQSAKMEFAQYQSKDDHNKVYYSDPKLPLKRNAGNAFSTLSENNLDYEIHVDSSCTECLECAAVCPVVALFEDDEDKLRINEASCTGCYLCSEFCPENSITILTTKITSW